MINANRLLLSTPRFDFLNPLTASHASIVNLASLQFRRTPADLCSFSRDYRA
jgi:hypothetical protein